MHACPPPLTPVPSYRASQTPPDHRIVHPRRAGRLSPLRSRPCAVQPRRYPVTPGATLYTAGWRLGDGTQYQQLDGARCSHRRHLWPAAADDRSVCFLHHWFGLSESTKGIGRAPHHHRCGRAVSPLRSRVRALAVQASGPVSHRAIASVRSIEEGEGFSCPTPWSLQASRGLSYPPPHSRPKRPCMKNP